MKKGLIISVHDVATLANFIGCKADVCGGRVFERQYSSGGEYWILFSRKFSINSQNSMIVSVWNPDTNIGTWCDCTDHHLSHGGLQRLCPGSCQGHPPQNRLQAPGVPYWEDLLYVLVLILFYFSKQKIQQHIISSILYPLDVAMITPSIHYTMGGLRINASGEVQRRCAASGSWLPNMVQNAVYEVIKAR